MNEKDMTEVRLSGEKIFDGRVIRVERDTVRLPDGARATREVVRHPGAVCVVPLTDKNEVLLVRQYRYPEATVMTEIPAGKLEPGEHSEEHFADAARRELREETGLSAERMTCLTTLLTTPGFCTEKIAVYLAQGLSQGDTHPDEDEFLGLVRLPLEEAFEMVMHGEICDGKTICGLMMAREIVARQKA